MTTDDGDDITNLVEGTAAQIQIMLADIHPDIQLMILGRVFGELLSGIEGKDRKRQRRVIIDDWLAMVRKLIPCLEHRALLHSDEGHA